MNRIGLMLAAAGLVCTGALANEAPTLPGDIVLGNNEGGFGGNSVEQIRIDGDGIGQFVDFYGESAMTTLAFAQSMSFDNAGASPRNAAGNLLSINFGASDMDGGNLYNFSTDGSGNSETVYTFDGMGVGTITPTRMSGLSVNPANTLVAGFGWGTGRMIVCEYSAGATVGTGVGASVTDAFESAPASAISETIGTVWLDDDTFVACLVDGVDVFTVATFDVDAGANTITRTDRITSGLGDFLASTSHIAIEYAPSVSPFIYVLYGEFAGATDNIMDVIDPATWSVTQTIDLSTSIGTARELAMGLDGSLYLAQFPFAPGGAIDRLDLDTDGSGTVDAADSLSDNSSVDFYVAQNGNNFMGITAALTTTATFNTGACCGYFVPGGTQINITAEEIDCGENGGIYAGDDTDPAVSCLPIPGACCLADGTCTDVSNADCISMGGIYFGAGTVCLDAVCGAPSGACVMTDGSCMDATGEACALAGGSYLGDGIDCAGASVPGTLVGKHDFDSNLVPFTAIPDNSANLNGQFLTSFFDVFGIQSRALPAPFDFTDDSTSIFLGDTQGIVSESKLDNHFAIMDTDNGDNPGGAFTATWTFDITGFDEVALSLHIGAMGNFETASDLVTFAASIDGGSSVTLIQADIIEGVRPIYTMDGGAQVFDVAGGLDDPFRVSNGDLSRGATILNNFQSFVSDTISTGGGSSLVVTLSGSTNGGTEPIVFDNLCLLGSEGGGPTCICETDGDAAQVNVTDLLSFLSLWFALDLGADVNNSGGVDVVDLLDFLSCWFPANSGAPCV